eukprot:m.135535 g.135535  ORF g.135535 m.135535 type:complete len:237 (+) comp13976_c0_seq1:132-842(+)
MTMSTALTLANRLLRSSAQGLRLRAQGVVRRPRKPTGDAKGASNSKPTTPNSAGASSAATKSVAQSTGAAIGNGNDIVLFKSERKGFFRLMTFACFAQAVFWGAAASLAPEVRDSEEDKRGQKADLVTRFGLTAGCAMLSVVFVGLGIMIPRRYITRLALTNTIKTVKVETYNVIGSRKFQVPVNGLAFSRSKGSQFEGTTLSVKIDGHRLFFMLDGRHGMVRDQRMFDWLYNKTK